VEVNVDHDACALTGQCAILAAEVFRIEGDELVYDQHPDESQRENVEDAVGSCPMQAISVGSGS
jgi:ferredoxin